MEKLPNSVLLDILSRLDDLADVARCRIASKVVNAAIPGLRSVNLRWSDKWHINSRPRVFLDLVSKLEAVESVCIKNPFSFPDRENDFYIIDGDFAKEWLPRVSGSLKSLSLSGVLHYSRRRQSDVLPLISAYCHNLVNLKLYSAWLSVHNMNPMPMLTSLTLEFTRLEDEDLSKLNKCCPNLQVLNLLNTIGLKDPKIHLLNLKTCHFAAYDGLESLTLITPNLITLHMEYRTFPLLHVEAPLLSNFYLEPFGLDSLYTGSLLSISPITTVQNLTIDSNFVELRNTKVSKLTLAKVFTVFPNMSSLCFKSGAWSELEACYNQEDWEILDGMNELKTISAYLREVDLSLTFPILSCVLDQCIYLSDVLLLIHSDVIGSAVSESFRSKCMARWPQLNWRWGRME